MLEHMNRLATTPYQLSDGGACRPGRSDCRGTARRVRRADAEVAAMLARHGL